MPEVIVDTSPLQYLHQLGLLDLLPNFYGEILIPESVVREIAAGRALGVALPELNTLPWIKVRRVAGLAVLPLVSDLGAGEREVLALALETDQPLVVLDDALARRVARRLDLDLTGNLGASAQGQKGETDRSSRTASGPVGGPEFPAGPGYAALRLEARR